MVVAAFVISVLALLASAASVLYIRRQAIHAGQVVAIEKERSRVERTPRLIVRPADEFHDEVNQHSTSLRLTNGAAFPLRDISVAVVADRPDQTAIIGLDLPTGFAQAGTLPTPELPPGATTTFDVVLAWSGERSGSGVLLFTVHDAQANEWVIEAEVEFPTSPAMNVW